MEQRIPEIRALWKKQFKSRLPSRPIGSPSVFGLVFRLSPEKVVKIFRSAGGAEKGTREMTIAMYLGKNCVGPKVYKMGFLQGSELSYMIMERLDGDLYELFATKELSKEDERSIEKQIRAKVVKMHELNVVHSDLKMDNIGYKMLNKNKGYKIYLIDFGYAISFPIKTRRNVSRGIALAYVNSGFNFEDSTLKRGAGDTSYHRMKVELDYDKKLPGKPITYIMHGRNYSKLKKTFRTKKKSIVAPEVKYRL